MRNFQNLKNLSVGGTQSSWGCQAQQINNIVAEQPDLLFLHFGINDLGNLEQYRLDYQRIKELYDCKLIITSVNPVEYHNTITNDMINDFNEQIKGAGDMYIDTYIELQNQGFSTIDGIHFTNETYQMINAILMYER